MRVRTENIPVSPSVPPLPALIVEPDGNPDTAPVLLFLHGKGEAGTSPNELPLVCLHQTPPFQALLGHLRGALIIAPQAPPLPSKDEWNWRDSVTSIARFVGDRFPRRRVLATGFSRGGLGVLQLISASPGLVERWAVVDPQPARDEQDTKQILPSPKAASQGWLRYGTIRNKDERWRQFSTTLAGQFPADNKNFVELSHDQMALDAYGGSPLSDDKTQAGLYGFLNLEFSKALEGSRSEFSTKRLPVAHDAVAPDQSDVRILLRLAGGSMAHFELAPRATSVAVAHKTIEEIWFFLTGRGEMWRRQGDREEVVPLEPGVCITIPLGTHFQFRSFGYAPLAALGVTMPPWPGEGEAYLVKGKWAQTATQSRE